MQTDKVIDYIVDWLGTYAKDSGLNGFVVGVSGGIDSAVTSTLCAKTGMETLALNMPIYQAEDQYARSSAHIAWLESAFENVKGHHVDLSPLLDAVSTCFSKAIQDDLTMANTRSRLRMVTLYAHATHHRMLVAGTGNKVEDFGVGFYTKYGDGGVDISPIADLVKSEVYELAKALGIMEDIQNAAPTDGLFEDNRTDEGQIGASYPELEWAMGFDGDPGALTGREKQVMEIYTRFNRTNRHKMEPIPVCIIPDSLRD